MYFPGFIRLMRAIRRGRNTPEQSFDEYVSFVKTTLKEVRTECLGAERKLTELEKILNKNFNLCPEISVAKSLVRYDLGKMGLSPSMQLLVAERLKARRQ